MEDRKGTWRYMEVIMLYFCTLIAITGLIWCRDNIEEVKPEIPADTWPLGEELERRGWKE